MELSFSVIDWHGWLQGEPGAASDSKLEVSESPDVSAIPAMLRRRLNLLGRAAASQMSPLLLAHGDIPIVYCSRHGDIERTLSVLEELAAGQGVSPMNFSLAVHNAVSGVVSIHHSLRAAISSIAAGDEALVAGLLEALGMLSGEYSKVLCAFADVVLPGVYQPTGQDAAVSYACCFVLCRDDTKGALRLEYVNGHAPRRDAAQLPQALEFAKFLSSNQATLAVSHQGGLWRIGRRTI